MNTPAAINIEQIHDVAVISPQGELAQTHETSLANLLASLIDNNHRKVVLNFSSVDHVHYRLAQQLCHVVNLFKQIDGDLVFAEATPYIKKIFQAVALDWQRGIYESTAEALMILAEEPLQPQALH